VVSGEAGCRDATINLMTSSSPALVRARGLTKKFGPHTAVNAIDFDIHKGEIVGFLGPNGAGKTTTIRMLLNLLNPTQGELSLFGLTFAENRTKILEQMNASSGSVTLPGKLSVWETLSVFGDMYGIANRKERVHELLGKFDLVSLHKKPLYSLSTGQQVRVSLAKAFLNRPRLLLLDEPTASLDPIVALRIRTHLKSVVQSEGTTVFLSSHNMREVEMICTRVLFLNHGKIQAEGTPSELAREVKRWKVQVLTEPRLKTFPKVPFPIESEVILENGELMVEMDKDHVGPFLTNLIKEGMTLEHISIQEPTLEDFFLHKARVHHDK